MRAEDGERQSTSGSGLLLTFAELRPALSRYLEMRGASKTEVDDLLQDIYVRLHAEGIGPVGQPRAYLYRMATNHFLLSRRTADRRRRREEDWVDAHSDTVWELDDRPSIEADLIAREEVTILQRVLDALPERTRLIFRRFRIEREPQRNIAADIGVSISAVEKHLTKAYGAISDARLRLDEDRGDPRHLNRERGRHDI